MPTLRAINISRDQGLADDLKVAGNFFSSLIGLMGRRRFHRGEGLWITPCQSIHTLWMRFSIDALFLDKDGTIVHLVENMKPFRASRHVARARGVLELPAETVHLSGTCLGDRVQFLQG